MLSALKKFGNSSGVIIPKPMLSEVGLVPGDDIRMTVDVGRIMIERVTADPRAGWAEDAKRLAEAGDDGLVWPEFANDGDDALIW